tara:strand:+ start:177 stop:578 length:402 start_codon:yes stop_codon:yes gene_type:complete
MANGTIAFDTLSTSGQIDGTARSIDTDYLLNGSAKCWINYDATASSDYTRDSFNVASTTDQNTGAHDIAFSNNMGNINYAGMTNGHRDDNQSISILQDSNNTTSGFRFKLNAFSSGTNTDSDSAFGAIFGELA